MTISTENDPPKKILKRQNSDSWVQIKDGFLFPFECVQRDKEVGGWGRDPKKCTGRDWGMGSSTI